MRGGPDLKILGKNTRSECALTKFIISVDKYCQSQFISCKIIHLACIIHELLDFRLSVRMDFKLHNVLATKSVRADVPPLAKGGQGDSFPLHQKSPLSPPLRKGDLKNS